MQTALTNATVFTGTEEITGKAILIENDSIEALVDVESIPESAKIIDCDKTYIAPGLIDLQIAGGGGFLFSAKPTVEALKAITNSIVESGTTGFLIVIPSNSFEIYREVIRIVKANPHPAVLGLHLEGPYINPVRRGAHFKDYIKRPQKKEIEVLLAEADGVVKMITLAPEFCDPGFIRFLKDNGVVVAAGHSNATFKEAVHGFEWGIQTTTHLFNAMSPLHHRDPGLPGATFETENIYASIIADGIHIDYNIISIAKKIMKERLYLVSDAVEENIDGIYLHVRRKDRFTLPDGTLSGSLLTMLKAVQNCVEHVGIPLDEALRMASSYPARLINASDAGQIARGFKANLIVFNKDFELKSFCINVEFNS
jgi:N-acetylglucosamine-6-phosphate deacetylase